MVVFEVEKVIELFWSIMVECKKVVKTEKSRVTPRYKADPNSARRGQLIDMSEGGSNTRGCAFLYGPPAGDMPESVLLSHFLHLQLIALLLSCSLHLRLDCLGKKVITFVSIAIEICATDISSYGGELGDQETLGHGWSGTATQLPLFCNCRFTGIRADGTFFCLRPTRCAVRLLFAFYTGSSDLGFPRSPL